VVDGNNGFDTRRRNNHCQHGIHPGCFVHDIQRPCTNRAGGGHERPYKSNDGGRGAVGCVEADRNPMNCDEKNHHENVAQSAFEDR